MKRRDFLKYMGAGAAALALDSCTPDAVKKPAKASTSNKDLHGEMLQHYPGIGVLGYGCMRWPQKRNEQGRNVIDQEEVNRLVDFALEHGVNYFDTSPVYLGGDSERATAEALNRHPRESWLIATKMSVFNATSYDDCVAMYHRSLDIFKTDHLDYYLLHGIGTLNDFNTRFKNTGVMEFLLKEREAGHIRNLGFSFHGNKEGFDQIIALHDQYHWDFVQIQMNYVDWEHPNGRNTRADYLYAELDKREIPIVIMEPLRGGALSDVPAQIADQLKEREPERSIASWAFRYVGSFPRVLTALSGMTYMEHLVDNLETYLDFQPLDDEEKKKNTYQIGHSISTGIIGFLTAFAIQTPIKTAIDKVITHADKYIKGSGKNLVRKEKIEKFASKGLRFGKKSYFCSRIPQERNRWWV